MRLDDKLLQLQGSKSSYFLNDVLCPTVVSPYPRGTSTPKGHHDRQSSSFQMYDCPSYTATITEQ